MNLQLIVMRKCPALFSSCNEISLTAGNDGAFAALKGDGSVITWGDPGVANTYRCFSNWESA